MKTQSIEIEILDATSDFIKVKLPFLDIPVVMNYQFFRPRLESGYFKIRNNTDHLYPILNYTTQSPLLSSPDRQNVGEALKQPVADQRI